LLLFSLFSFIKDIIIMFKNWFTSIATILTIAGLLFSGAASADWATLGTELAKAQTALEAIGAAVMTSGVVILAGFAGLNALKRFAFSVV
jgi:hypothetical protein